MLWRNHRLYMSGETIHNVVGCVISADPYWKPKILLVKRQSRENGEKSWPDCWCYVTEHKEPGEDDRKTLVRGLEEELRLPPPLLIRGPVPVESWDPLHHELFRVNLYQCVLTDLEQRMLLNPTLNQEAQRWVWTSTLSAFHTDAALYRELLFDDLHVHMRALLDSGLPFEKF